MRTHAAIAANSATTTTVSTMRRGTLAGMLASRSPTRARSAPTIV
jgi:hypothetical protein